MNSPLSRSPFIIAGLALTLVPWSHAFFPSELRETAFGEGTAHETQTRDAFDALAKTFFPSIGSLTSSMIDARDAISRANMDVDDDQEHSAKHFDGENFDGGQALLIQAKKDVGDALRRGDADYARSKLGAALHTVQDFYAHSNWLELGNEDIEHGLGREDHKFDVAALNDRTCNGCELPAISDSSSCMNCNKSSDGFDKLTSGYSFGEDAPLNGQPIPDWKCRHGGATGGNGNMTVGAAPLTIAPGINKDSSNCSWSPHSYLHNRAALQATNASMQYIKDLVADEQLTEPQMKLLFGAGNTMALTLDGASNLARQQALSIAHNRLKSDEEPSVYVLTTFGREPLVIPDFETLQSHLNSTIQSRRVDALKSEGDCHGACVPEALNAMNSAGDLFILSETPLRATAEQTRDTIDSALARNVQIHVIDYVKDALDYVDVNTDNVIGENDTWDRREILRKRSQTVSGRLYSALTAATGGSYVTLPKSRPATWAFPLSRLQQKVPPSDTRERILDVAGDQPATSNFTFAIDSGMTSFTLSVSGTNITYNVTQPDGKPYDTGSGHLTDVFGSQYLTVKDPAPGLWGLVLSPTADTASASFKVTISGVSPIKFSQFSYLRLGGRAGHEGYYPTTSPSTEDSPALVSAFLNGNFSSARFSRRDDLNRVLDDGLQMEQGSGKLGERPKASFFGKLQSGAGNGKIFVEGLDGMGMPFQRVWSGNVGVGG